MLTDFFQFESELIYCQMAQCDSYRFNNSDLTMKSAFTQKQFQKLSDQEHKELKNVWVSMKDNSIILTFSLFTNRRLGLFFSENSANKDSKCVEDCLETLLCLLLSTSHLIRCQFAAVYPNNRNFGTQASMKKHLHYNCCVVSRRHFSRLWSEKESPQLGKLFELARGVENLGAGGTSQHLSSDGH